jgi:hypothetical protein
MKPKYIYKVAQADPGPAAFDAKNLSSLGGLTAVMAAGVARFIFR